MTRLRGGTTGKAAFGNAAKRTATRRNNIELLEWMVTYQDTVAPLLPSTITLPLEATCRQIRQFEHALGSDRLGCTGQMHTRLVDGSKRRSGVAAHARCTQPDNALTGDTSLASVGRSPSPMKVATRRRGNVEAKAIRKSESTTCSSLFSPSPRDDNMHFVKPSRGKAPMPFVDPSPSVVATGLRLLLLLSPFRMESVW